MNVANNGEARRERCSDYNHGNGVLRGKESAESGLPGKEQGTQDK